MITEKAATRVDPPAFDIGEAMVDRNGCTPFGCTEFRAFALYLDYQESSGP
jgi:hypothetical protein